MTAKEQVLKVYKDAYTESKWVGVNIYYVMYGETCIGAGFSPKSAWQSALDHIKTIKS